MLLEIIIDVPISRTAALNHTPLYTTGTIQRNNWYNNWSTLTLLFPTNFRKSKANSANV